MRFDSKPAVVRRWRSSVLRVMLFLVIFSAAGITLSLVWFFTNSLHKEMIHQTMMAYDSSDEGRLELTKNYLVWLPFGALCAVWVSIFTVTWWSLRSSIEKAP